MKKIFATYFLALGIMLQGCIEPYTFDGSDTDKSYVIEATITDLPGIQTIKITKTIEFKNELNPGVSGAQVKVMDSDGGEEVFYEVGDGVYASGPSYSAKPGLEYTLEVRTLEGEKIVSEISQLNYGEEYFELSYKPVTKYSLNFDNKEVEQYYVQVYVKINPATDASKYYKFNVLPSYIYIAQLAPEDAFYRECYVQGRNEEVVSIWKDDIEVNKDGSVELLIHELYFDRRFEKELRLEVRQQHMDKGAYDFWKEIETQRKNNGGIFDPIPTIIKGNLSMEGSEELVLGNFSIVHENAMHTYLSQDDLPYEIGPMDCTPPPRQWPPRFCFDCTYHNSGIGISTDEPNWW